MISVLKIAISSRIATFINTNCFNQVLNRQWFGQLPGNTTESLEGTLKFIVSVTSFGLIPHSLRKYREQDDIDQKPEEMVSLF